MELGNTNNCKEELSFQKHKTVTQKHRQKQLLSTLNMKNFIAGHEHSTRDSRGQRLISINPFVTEQNHREPP